MKVFGVYCYNCRMFVYSRARHDFNPCNCWSKNKSMAFAIDGGQSDYFKLTSGEKSLYSFLKIDIDQSEEELIEDWSMEKNQYGSIYIESINHYLVKHIGAVSKSDLKDGQDYNGICRHAKVAKWSQKDNCFYYIRKKFDKIFLDRINHPEDDDGYDLFIPIKLVKDERISLNEDFHCVDSTYFKKYPKEDDNE
mgnify:CR=1 FL=1